MSQLIDCGCEQIRINQQNNSIEYSRDGINWTRRCASQAYGTFRDLCIYGDSIYAATSQGVYYSHDKGVNWTSKCRSNAYGDFHTIQAIGTELFANTSKGLYFSRDKGVNWMRK